MRRLRAHVAVSLRDGHPTRRRAHEALAKHPGSGAVARPDGCGRDDRAAALQDRSRLPGQPHGSARRRRAAATRGGRRPRTSACTDADELPVGAPDRRATGRASATDICATSAGSSDW